MHGLIEHCSIFSLSTFGIPSMRLRRVKKHLANIMADDALLVRENFGERLTVVELREALEERGMYVKFHIIAVVLPFT